MGRKAKDEKQPRQGALPGMVDKAVREIQAAAEEYIDARDRRMALTITEVETKDALIAAMHKHKRKRYFDGLFEITVKSGDEKVRAKRKGEADVDAQ
jgi:hypothetical protein